MKAASQILNCCVENTTVACQGQLPSIAPLKKTVQRPRTDIRLAPCQPPDLQSLEIPEEFKMYKTSEGTLEKFLLADSGPGVGRILILGREKYTEVFKNCGDCGARFGDYTFKITLPYPFFIKCMYY